MGIASAPALGAIEAQVRLLEGGPRRRGWAGFGKRFEAGIAAARRRTRAMLVSSVGWVTGERLDLGALSELAAKRGFFLVVDAVQQLGGVAIDCSKLRIDFLTSGGYKWLNAPFGCGVLYVSRGVHELGLRVRRVGLLGLEEPASGWDSFYESPHMKPLPDLRPARSVRRFEAQRTPNRLGA